MVKSLSLKIPDSLARTLFSPLLWNSYDSAWYTKKKEKNDKNWTTREQCQEKSFIRFAKIAWSESVSSACLHIFTKKMVNSTFFMYIKGCHLKFRSRKNEMRNQTFNVKYRKTIFYNRVFKIFFFSFKKSIECYHSI